MYARRLLEEIEIDPVWTAAGHAPWPLSHRALPPMRRCSRPSLVCVRRRATCPSWGSTPATTQTRIWCCLWYGRQASTRLPHCLVRPPVRASTLECSRAASSLATSSTAGACGSCWPTCRPPSSGGHAEQPPGVGPPLWWALCTQRAAWRQQGELQSVGIPWLFFRGLACACPGCRFERHRVHIGEKNPPGVELSYSELLASSVFCFVLMGELARLCSTPILS
jgi:hypothetical protein